MSPPATWPVWRGTDVPGRHTLAEWRASTEPWAASYYWEALLDPIWNPRTLCGREWIEMEPGDGPSFDGERDGVYAPSCRNYLRIISGGLEGVAPDERIPLVVGLVVTDVLADAGTVGTGVPGEQLELLKASIRQRFRSIGVACRTYPVGGDLHVVRGFSHLQASFHFPQHVSKVAYKLPTRVSLHSNLKGA